jgi:hypothetical protein
MNIYVEYITGIEQGLAEHMLNTLLVNFKKSVNEYFRL